MNRFISTLTLLLICISFNVKAQVFSASVLKQLEKSEKAMFDATSNGDSAAFRKIAGKDYFTINADGKSANLEQSMFDVPKFKGSATELSEKKQRIFGNVVLRSGKAKFLFGGQTVAEVLYTTGWVYRDKRWQFIHWQGTPTGMSLQGKTKLEAPGN
ncbi:MAG: nuclear transport factor 2 family protein [Ferruginibacter sp.]